ncbi:MAG: hypothetical protein IPJ87_01465 [Flavobacteriales bacterium]|nr:hypothetical protein [Flavobacteriales bacterium]
MRQQVFRIEQRNAQARWTCRSRWIPHVGLHTGAGDVRLAGRRGVAHLYSGFLGPIDAGALAGRR